MKTLKKILKYTSLVIGLLIFIWISHGFYLYINLPDIEITEKTRTLPNGSLDVDTVLNLLTPEKKHFHNKKDYSNFLAPSSVVYIEKYFSPKYQLCFRKLNYQVPLIEKIYNGGTWFNLIGFEYNIIGNYDEMTKKYEELLKSENFPLNVDLVKGNNCDEKIIKTYSLSLDKEGNEFLLQLKEK